MRLQGWIAASDVLFVCDLANSDTTTSSALSCWPTCFANIFDKAADIPSAPAVPRLSRSRTCAPMLSARGMSQGSAKVRATWSSCRDCRRRHSMRSAPVSRASIAKDRLAAEDRPALAVPLLEIAERDFFTRPRDDFDLRRVRCRRACRRSQVPRAQWEDDAWTASEKCGALASPSASLA
jgi:hypothetical protein